MPKINVSGRVIAAAVMSGSGKKRKVKIETRYGYQNVPFEAKSAKKEDVEKAAVKTVVEVVPQSQFMGTVGNKGIFLAPENWKGGFNA